METLEEPDGFVEPRQLVNWAMATLNIMKPQEELTDGDIAKIMRWIGMCAVDTILIDGDKPILGRIAIGLMLSVTLLEFPEFYVRHELSQFN